VEPKSFHATPWDHLVQTGEELALEEVEFCRNNVVGHGEVEDAAVHVQGLSEGR
jgi:hypothetical protein